MADVSVEDFKDKAGSVYEALTVMCKRARQINDEQKMQIMEEMDALVIPDTRESEDFDDVEIDREALERDHKTYPKPSSLAIAEMARGDMEYYFIEPDDEKKSEQTETT